MKRAIVLLIALPLLLFCYYRFVYVPSQPHSSGSLKLPQIRRLPSPVRQVLTNLLPSPPPPTPPPTPVTPETVLEQINAIRLEEKYSPLKHDGGVCPVAQKILVGEPVVPAQISKLCVNCTQLVSISLDKRASLETAIEYIRHDATAAGMLKNKKLTVSCGRENSEQLVFVAAQKISPPSPLPPRTISEDELWQALTEYRNDHRMASLTKDEKLCEYARKRVDEHITLINEKKPKESYPTPAKYPLDAHAGFQRDAESGVVFQITGKNEVAENLAYWPDARYATHVIEWGWDSSTEGHRETQLSNDFSTACLTGKQGFFVAIFGR